jgi:hypothetical protein
LTVAPEVIVCVVPKYASKAGVLVPPALAKVLSPLRKVVASLVPVAESLASPIVPSDTVPTFNTSPKYCDKVYAIRTS